MSDISTAFEGQGNRHRALWSAVVLQAREDVECAAIGSITYDQACGFFVGAGDWLESRRQIADHLGLHEREIRAAGARWIAARRQREGLPAVEAARQRPAPVSPVRLQAVEASPQPDRRRLHHGHVREHNPFAAYRAA